jgi:hypothetical protein
MRLRSSWGSCYRVRDYLRYMKMGVMSETIYMRTLRQISMAMVKEKSLCRHPDIKVYLKT